MSVQPQNNNLNYLIDPTLTNVNRLFVLSFFQEIIIQILDILFQITMYLKLKSMTSTF